MSERRPTPGLPQRAALVLLVMLVMLPMTALLAYALTDRWDDGWRPQGLTGRWIVQAISAPAVHLVALRTVGLSACSTALAIVLGGSASITASLVSALSPARGPQRVLVLLDLLAVLPYALPPVVIAIGALDIWLGRTSDIGWLVPRPVLYVAVVVPTLFPLIHRTLRAALAQLDAAVLIEAGRTLGASDARILARVVLPLLAPALGTAALMMFATATMEFAIANLLLGGDWQLLQPMLNGMRGTSGGQAAALAVLALITVALPAALAQAAAVRLQADDKH